MKEYTFNLTMPNTCGVGAKIAVQMYAHALGPAIDGLNKLLRCGFVARDFEPSGGDNCYMCKGRLA